MEFGFEFKTIDIGKPLKSLFLESDMILFKLEDNHLWLLLWGTGYKEARVEAGKQKGEDDTDKFFSSETILRNN